MEVNSTKFESPDAKKSEPIAESGNDEWIATMNCNNKIITDPNVLFKELQKRDSQRFFETAIKCQDDMLLSCETDPFDGITELNFQDEEFQNDLKLLTLRDFPIKDSSTPIAQVTSMTSNQDPDELGAASLLAITKPKHSYTEAPPDKECFNIVQEIGNLLLKLQERQVRNMQQVEDSLLDNHEEAAQYEVPSNEYYMVSVHRSGTDGSLGKCILQPWPFLKVIEKTKNALVWTSDQERKPSLLRKPMVTQKTLSMFKQHEPGTPSKSIIDIHLPNPGLNSHFKVITPPTTSTDILPSPNNARDQKASTSNFATKASSSPTTKAPTKKRSHSYSKLTYPRRCQ